MKSNLPNTLNILHLSTRHDREASLTKQLLEQGIDNYIIWEGEVFPHNPKMGVCRGHKRIVQFAKDTNQPYVHIAENDVLWFDKGAWEYYLSQLDTTADMFLSMVYVGTINNDNRLVSIASGFTMYTVMESFYDVFLATSDDAHVDRVLTAMHEQYKFIVCNPFTCEQINNNKSDNTKTISDYRPFLKGRKLFGGLEII